ncbi:MFS transporter [Lactobacillus gigeriorum]|uniref:Permease of the major facilitator superfamily n=2 Tax=Lactobacillus gigeriorum DSM 23908 = CRBIP 24.85 TaxID=1423751 RepID=A0ABR5PY61_9LACO|nr:MFS transporter [Lactobacillus gigeriorum]KRN13789.1 permease of the major facilitator superfamily [Lactobacillus gigeriorum DSM 23908 = CRBIP 24.85]
MKKYKYIYYYISILYTVGVSLWSGTIYLFMRHVGYNYSQINLFLSIFWIVTFFAEIPSGYIADRFGYLKTIIVSAIIRAIGLLILAFSPFNLAYMVLSGILTAIGDSLQSGTMDSWIANKSSIHHAKNELGSIYSGYRIIATPITMLATFVGANILGNINLQLPLIAGAFFLIITSFTILPLLRYDSQNLQSNVKIWSGMNLVSDVKEAVKHERKTLGLILLLLPIAIISSGPLDQWQIYFQHGKYVNSGTISVFMTLSGMLAITIYNRFVSKKQLKDNNQLKLIVISSVMMTFTIWAVVMTKSNYYASLAIFMIHTMFGSVENLIAGVVLQTAIETENRRATIISVSNALDAGIEVVALAANGYLSDRYGIGPAWISLAICGLVIFLIGYLVSRKRLV